MILDALNPPNMCTEVAIELINVPNARSPAYSRRCLTRNLRIDDKGYEETHRTESTCHGRKISYWEDQ